MSKEEVSFRLKIWKLIAAHPWLKLISLILAIIAWFYVRGEINKFN